MSWYTMGGYLKLYLKNQRKIKFTKERVKFYNIYQTLIWLSISVSYDSKDKYSFCNI